MVYACRVLVKLVFGFWEERLTVFVHVVTNYVDNFSTGILVKRF